MAREKSRFLQFLKDTYRSDSINPLELRVLKYPDNQIHYTFCLDEFAIKKEYCATGSGENSKAFIAGFMAALKISFPEIAVENDKHNMYKISIFYLDPTREEFDKLSVLMKGKPIMAKPYEILKSL